MKKKIMTLALTAAMAASMGMTAFAGQWVQNTYIIGEGLTDSANIGASDDAEEQ